MLLAFVLIHTWTLHSLVLYTETEITVFFKKFPSLATLVVVKMAISVAAIEEYQHPIRILPYVVLKNIHDTLFHFSSIRVNVC